MHQVFSISRRHSGTLSIDARDDLVLLNRMAAHKKLRKQTLIPACAQSGPSRKKSLRLRQLYYWNIWILLFTHRKSGCATKKHAHMALRPNNVQSRWKEGLRYSVEYIIAGSEPPYQYSVLSCVNCIAMG